MPGIEIKDTAIQQTSPEVKKKGISHTIISIVPPKLFYMCKTYSKIIYLD